MAATGYMKTDDRLPNCPLKGSFGDADFAFVCGSDHNIRKILAHLRALLAWIAGMLLNAIPGAGPIIMPSKPSERVV